MKKMQRYLITLYKKKEYLNFAGCCFLLTTALLFLIWVLVILLTQIINFGANNFEVICLVILGMFYIVYQNKSKLSQQIEHSVDTNITDNITNVSYKVLADEIYLLLIEIARCLNLCKPNSTKDIVHTEKMSYDKRGFYIYNFLILKNGIVDINSIKKLINVKLEQYLKLYDSDVLCEYVSYNGILYLPYMVHSVKDLGEYVHIKIVGTTKEYCRLLELKESKQNNYKIKQNKKIVDEDF